MKYVLVIGSFRLFMDFCYKTPGIGNVTGKLAIAPECSYVNVNHPENIEWISGYEFSAIVKLDDADRVGLGEQEWAAIESRLVVA